jgi:uncharacterized protein (TIGR02147 family)
MKSPMKSIFSYACYRDFLRDEFQREKRSSRGTTIAAYSRRFKISPAALNMILTGARQLTVEKLHEFARALRLSAAEYEYFEALVLKERCSGDVRAKAYYTKRLAQIARRSGPRSVRLAQSFLLQEWLLPALLIHLLDVELKRRPLEAVDPAAVAKKFGVAPEQAKRLIDFCKKSGLLASGAEGPMHLVFERLATQVPQKVYLRSVLGEALRQVDADFTNPDSIHRAMVFSMPKALLHELRLELSAVFERYMARATEDPQGNILLQAAVSVFPVVPS